MDKNYEPEVVEDNPFPGETAVLPSQDQSGSGDNLTPTTTKEKILPRKRTAVELLSAALNTRSRKVLENFDLVQSGGFQIGDFKEGISGDVRLTPNGITGRNIAGLTTFSLDTDGNLILVGEMRSGSVITGNITLEEGGSIEIGSGVVLDEFGIVSSTNFQNANNIQSAVNQDISSGSDVEITNSSYTITLPRTATVFLIFMADCNLVESVGNTGNGGINLNVDGIDVSQVLLASGNTSALTLTGYHIVSLAAGIHTIKLEGFILLGSGSPLLHIIGIRTSYFVLGT